MSLTPNFGLNIPDAGDIVNLLTQCYPNFTLIDTAMQSIKETGVTTATETKSGTAHQVVRTDTDCNVLRFTATSNFVTGDTFTVDGVPVTGVAVNGTSLQTGDFVINSDVMAILNGGKLTLLTGGSGANDASDVTYDNTGSGLSATDVQQAIDELKGDIPTSFDADDVVYDNTNSGLVATNVQDAIDEIKNLITHPYITTGLVTSNCTINDGGYYIDNGVVFVNISVTITANVSAGTPLISSFPQAGTTGIVTPAVEGLQIERYSTNTYLEPNTSITAGTTCHFIGTYSM